MKKLIKLNALLFAGLLTFSACSSSNGNTNTKQNEKKDSEVMTGDKLLEEQKKGALVIDVRPDSQFNAGHIEGAKNIPLEVIETEIAKVEPNKDKKIILYCNTGNKSGKATSKLKKLGYKDINNAQGVKQFDYKLVK